jgi:hypothetical protein
LIGFNEGIKRWVVIKAGLLVGLAIAVFQDRQNHFAWVMGFRGS